MAETTGKHWVTEPHQCKDPILTESGFGAIPPITVIDLFKQVVEKHGDCNAMAVKRPLAGGAVPANWTYYTYKDYFAECRKFAKSLVHYKVDTFKIVNVLGFNSPEWFIASVGAILGGSIAAGIYTTNSADSCKYVSEHSKAEIVVLEGNKQLEKYATMASKLPNLKAIVVYGGVIDPIVAEKCGKPVHTWEEFQAIGAGVADSVVDERAATIKPGNCASLIYTSGTTGPPKAVMISHDNITWTAKNVVEHYMDLNHTDKVISYLPLSHIAAQMIDVYCMMVIGGCAYFAQPDALKGSLTTTMRDVKPTFFFGVPRVWEKIMEKMVQMGRASTGIKKSLATWAKGVGAEHCRLMEYGNGGGTPWGYGCANSVVLSKIKEALGLDHVKGCFTAAAPIAPETLYYFASLDIPVLEVFGQSECTGPHTVCGEKAWKIGTCGRPMKGTQTKVPSGNMELCYRGRHIFMGYMYMPDQTRDTIDEDGYLHSGDVAAFDEDEDKDIPSPSGFMKITGRIKELLITAGGENVPPVLIENEMKNAMVALSNCMVLGDKRKFLAMVVSLKVEMDPESGLPKEELAADSLFVGQQIGSSAKTYTEAKADPLWKKYVDEGMKAANKKTTSNAQIVQKWAWLPCDFSEKAGDLTPTLKLKRKVANERNAELIESLYAEAK